MNEQQQKESLSLVSLGVQPKYEKLQIDYFTQVIILFFFVIAFKIENIQKDNHKRFYSQKHFFRVSCDIFKLEDAFSDKV